MVTELPSRRDVLRLLGAFSVAQAIDWAVFPRAAGARPSGDTFDAIIIGAGLGGLSCAAAFVRQGFRPLVLEQRDRAGGYASSFRVGDFEFDVSLHSTTATPDPSGRRHVFGFPELDVEFQAHPNLYRLILPNHDLRVPQRDLGAYQQMLIREFPDQARGLRSFFRELTFLANDAERFISRKRPPAPGRVPVEFPFLCKHHKKTWAELVETRIDDPELRAILSAQWGYFGVSPSRLSALYYGIGAMGYLRKGGYYPRGTSQSLSNSFVKAIESGGGTVLLNRKVVEITTEDGVATGVRTANGEEYRAKVVVSNADARATFDGMLGEDERLSDYRADLARQPVSMSAFQVFLGLKKDLVGESGVIDSEVFLQSTYDIDADVRWSRDAEVGRCAMSVTLYDNIYEGYSPPGKNTLNILVLQGYSHWEPFEADYDAGDTTAYDAERDRLAALMISRVERELLPGLADAIEVQSVATPLTFARHGGCHRGAIYGFEQVIENSAHRRTPHVTPIKGLYLSGAWTRPGHGYYAVMLSGLQCFQEIMTRW